MRATVGHACQDGMDWSDIQQNALNRSIRRRQVERELVATCGACRLMFFVEAVRHPQRDGMATTDLRVADSRIERGRVHRRCGGRIRLWRWSS